MLIPPSAMLIIYAIVTEQSVGHMFLAGIIPGIILSIAYALLILVMAYVRPSFVGGRTDGGGDWVTLTLMQAVKKLLPVVILVLVVLGGIYRGVVTPVEAGAAGSMTAMIIAVLKRSFSWRMLWEVMVETGHITAVILFLIVTASMYSRMLGVAGLPTTFGAWLEGLELGFVAVMIVYVVLLILLGTIIDTASIILIVVPLFLPVMEVFGGDLIWFGIVTVVGAEIGLLTPPLGLSCFAIKSVIDDPSITLFDIFAGAFPFALTMLLVLILIIAFPSLSLMLV
jgi:tripartite ATP-independent transporter DctM subunit